jgi:tetratricopeptide (TPR) repeat protein
MLISIVKKYWILGSLVIAMVPNSFLSPQVLAQSKTFVQPQPQILSQLTAIDYNNRGFVKIESGDYQGAIADFNQAIKLQPDYATAYNNRGLLKMGAEDNQGAITDFNQAIKLQTDYALAYNNRGILKMKSRDNQGAITDFNQAIKSNPDYATAYNNRGISKYNLGDNQGAISDFRQSAKLYQQQNKMQDYQDAINVLKELGVSN